MRFFKSLVWTFIVLLPSFLTAQTAKLVKTKINETLTVSIPADFTMMAENVYTKKYGAYRPPIAIYTSPNGYADFGINESINRSLKAFNKSDFKEEDLTMLKSMYKSSVMAMHSEVSFTQDKIETINGRKFLVLEFVGVVRDEDKAITIGNSEKKHYNYLMYSVEEGKVLIFNFNCPANMRSQWQATAKDIMQSIKITKAKK
jgi:hypothetical protein